MERLRLGLYASVVMIILGIALMAVPHDDADMHEVATEAVWIEWAIGTGTNIDLRRGNYEIWIEDRVPGVRDYDHFGFAIESLDDRIEVTMSDGSVTRDLDGVPHELYCTFQVARSDMYFYETWMEGNITGGEDQFEIVFMRGGSLPDQPLFWAGMTLIIVGSIAIPVLLMMRRDKAKDRGPGEHLYP